jgi:hypothetical protein
MGIKPLKKSSCITLVAIVCFLCGLSTRAGSIPDSVQEFRIIGNGNCCDVNMFSGTFVVDFTTDTLVSANIVDQIDTSIFSLAPYGIDITPGGSYLQFYGGNLGAQEAPMTLLFSGAFSPSNLSICQFEISTDPGCVVAGNLAISNSVYAGADCVFTLQSGGSCGEQTDTNDYISGTITQISTTPEPNAVLLFGTVMLGAIFFTNLRRMSDTKS